MEAPSWKSESETSLWMLSVSCNDQVPDAMAMTDWFDANWTSSDISDGWLEEESWTSAELCSWALLLDAEGELPLPERLLGMSQFIAEFSFSAKYLSRDALA
jgi:hypothetical protein